MPKAEQEPCRQGSSNVVAHVRSLWVLRPNKRSWGFLLVATLAVGLPVLAGAWLDRFSPAIIASMGGLVILYMQSTHMSRRMMILVICSFGFAARSEERRVGKEGRSRWWPCARRQNVDNAE